MKHGLLVLNAGSSSLKFALYSSTGSVPSLLLIMRYGFHGLSNEYITGALAEYNDGHLPERLIVAHLGNGASLCKIKMAGYTVGYSRKRPE